MPRFETKTLYSAEVLTAGQTKTTRWFEASELGLTGYLSYQYDVTGSVKITVERGIIEGTADPVVVSEDTFATAKGIKDVSLPLCKYLRFKITETTGSAGATVTKLAAVFA